MKIRRIPTAEEIEQQLSFEGALNHCFDTVQHEEVRTVLLHAADEFRMETNSERVPDLISKTVLRIQEIFTDIEYVHDRVVLSQTIFYLGRYRKAEIRDAELVHI